MFRPQLVTITCPQCGVPFQTPVFSIIDVKRQPELKTALLSGQLNAAQCPSCGRVTYIAGPLLYHAPDKEFLAVYIPMEANIPEAERQKIIGDLTNALMNALPAEERKGYLFTPQQFFDLETLIRKILEMDGVTPEMIEASQRKIALVEKLLNLQGDEMAFNMAVSENQDLLDREFFMILADAIERDKALGQENRVKALEALRERLMPVTEFGRRLLKQRKAVEALGPRPTREQVQQAILDGDLEEVEAIAIAALPMFDYTFFQWLTDRIEEASGEERESLEAKRDLILKLLETLRKIDEEATRSAARVAEELIRADDLDQTIQELAPFIDERVIEMLMAELAVAQQQGAPEMVERIQTVINTLQEVVSQSVPPEMTLIFDLLEADYPNGTKSLLEQKRESVNDAFFALLDAFIQDAQTNPSYDPKTRDDLVRFLKNIRVQATLLRQ